MNYQEFSASIKAKYPQYQNVDDLELAKSIVSKYPQYGKTVVFDTATPADTVPPKWGSSELGSGLASVGKKEGFFPKVWEGAKIPEAMSREGLTKMAGWVPSVEPTGNAFRDVALNTPKIMADTVAEVAPGFASRSAMVMGGAGKVAKMGIPVLSSVGRAVGDTAEKISGLSYKTPGVLADAFQNPGLLFARGKAAAGKLYSVAQDAKGIRDELQGPLTESQFVDKALEIAKSSALTADEALEARKALDGIKNTLAGRGYKATRDFFDKIAKVKFKGADEAYSRATKAEALRSFLPMNKGGTPSIVKSSLMGLVSPLAPVLSPMVQGATASALGAIAKPILPTLGTKLPYTLGAVRSVLNRR